MVNSSSRLIEVEWSEDPECAWSSDEDVDEWLWLPETVMVPGSVMATDVANWLLAEYGVEPCSWSYLTSSRQGEE